MNLYLIPDNSFVSIEDDLLKNIIKNDKNRMVITYDRLFEGNERINFNRKYFSIFDQFQNVSNDFFAYNSIFDYFVNKKSYRYVITPKNIILRKNGELIGEATNYNNGNLKQIIYYDEFETTMNFDSRGFLSNLEYYDFKINEQLRTWYNIQSTPFLIEKKSSREILWVSDGFKKMVFDCFDDNFNKLIANLVLAFIKKFEIENIYYAFFNSEVIYKVSNLSIEEVYNVIINNNATPFKRTTKRYVNIKGENHEIYPELLEDRGDISFENSSSLRILIIKQNIISVKKIIDIINDLTEENIRIDTNNFYSDSVTKINLNQYKTREALYNRLSSYDLILTDKEKKYLFDEFELINGHSVVRYIDDDFYDAKKIHNWLFSNSSENVFNELNSMRKSQFSLIYGDD